MNYVTQTRDAVIVAVHHQLHYFCQQLPGHLGDL